MRMTKHADSICVGADSGQDSFEDDAAVARRLDAEINSGTRSTRRREAPVSSDGGRATR